jgi:crotonobetainyl-CoA:carnitine CoA-transferase CaiB-like acyl-CoA transferase
VFRAAPLSGVASALEPLPHAVTGDDAGPLAGVKVIEIGQYTTAPLVGKHLAALGAQVVKIEPPDGEVARAWTPGQGGTSYFFALNNTDKQTLALDLKHEKDRAYLRTLLADADVLVENLRPGALAKLGFDRTALAEINPRLIYCSISGFGMESAYPSRPAFDTVIQAMGGLMDLTRSDGVPVKFGASGADILGGQAALLAIVASLASRAGGAGTFIEISMQDFSRRATRKLRGAR